MKQTATGATYEIERNRSRSVAGQFELEWSLASSAIFNRAQAVAVGSVSMIRPFGGALLTLVSSMIRQPVTSGAGESKRDRPVRSSAYALPLIPFITLFFPATVNAASL